MRVFLLRVFLFLIVLIVPVFFLGKLDNLDRNSSGNINVIKLQNKSKYDSLHILFIGNSYTYSGIIPHYFDSLGLLTFNLGISTAGPYFYDLVIEDYLNSSNKNPQSVFILISPMTFSKMADNFVSYPIHRYLEPPISNEKIVHRYGLSDKYFALQKRSFVKGMTNLLGVRNNETTTIEDLRIHKGFVPSTAINSKKTEDETRHLYFPLKSGKFDEEKFNYLLKISKDLKKQKIKVVFYELGYNKLEDYFNKDFISEYGKAINILKEDFIFLENDLNLPDNYFRNIDHLNTSGAQKYTKHLIDKIKDNAELNKLLQIEKH